MSNRQRTALMTLVSLVWAANMLAPLFIKDYKPQEGVHVAFMAVLGYLTAGFNDKDGTKDKDEKPAPRKRAPKKRVPK